MARLLLSGRFVRGTLHSNKTGQLLTCELRDWEACHFHRGQIIGVAVGYNQPKEYLIQSLITCLGGEPVAWVWLKPKA